MSLYVQGIAAGVAGTLVLAGAGMCLAGGIALEGASASQELSGEPQLLAGNRAVFGTVEAVTSDQLKVDIGELQPRFVPVKPAQEKHLGNIRPGDPMVLVLNEQNLIVDYHPVDAAGDVHSHHRIIGGRIAQDLPVGHERVVIRTDEGREESHEIRSQARSKVASIPVNIPALFLIDESNQVADATFADRNAVQDAHRSFDDKAPLKGAQRRVDGTIVRSNDRNQVTIRTQEGKEERFQVRPLMQDQVAKLNQGEEVVLLIDASQQVFDLAVPPHAGSAK